MQERKPQPTPRRKRIGALRAAHYAPSQTVVRPVQLDLLFTILAAFVVLFGGRALVARVGELKRFNIPAPVVGGVIAVLVAPSTASAESRLAST